MPGVWITDKNGQPVDTSNPLAIGGSGFRSAVTITRPSDTTGYTAGDVIGDTGGSAILAFTSIGPPGGNILITSCDLRVDISAVPSGMVNFRLHLYDASPTARADNAAWDLGSGDRSAYLGYIDMGTPVDVGSTLYVRQDSVNAQFKLAAGSTTLYGELVTDGAYTPSSAAVYVPRLHATSL